MRVCIDVSAAVGQTAGIARYVRELTLALHRLPDGPHLSLFHNRQHQDHLPVALGNHTRTRIPLGNRLWRLWLLSGLSLPRQWTRDLSQSDLFHATDVTLPKLAMPSVLTVYDLTPMLFPQFHARLNRWYQRMTLPKMLTRAAAVIAISQKTKDDLVRSFQVDPARIHVTMLGVDHTRFASQPKEEALAQVHAATGIEAPYVLAVGTLEPRKNLMALLHAYATLPPSTPPLVLTGSQGWGDQVLTAMVEQLQLKERVRFTGYVADEVLPALYAAAELFVYPSLYEGFGLPVLEAMACGVPVITSQTSSLPEVTGDAAVLVDPRRSDQIATAIQTLLASPAQCRALREAGLARAHTFSWAKCAGETLNVYRHVLRVTQ